MVLGVSGAKSFSGFMVAVRGDSRSPATPQPAAGRAAPGLGESAAPRCLRRRLMDHAAPGRLSRSAAARRLGTGVGSPSPHTGPRPPNRSGVPVGPRTAVLKGQQPCYLDHVTLQQLPPLGPAPLQPRPARTCRGFGHAPQGSTFSLHTPAFDPNSLSLV